MSGTELLSQRLQNYRPTKTVWFWSMGGASAITMIVGFTIGGWTTGGSASLMSNLAAREARSALAASICVQNFVTSAGATDNLVALKQASTWQRNSFIEDGGWSKLAGVEETITGAATLCADKLVAMESIPKQSADALGG